VCLSTVVDLMSRSSAVDRIAGLFRIVVIVPGASTGLLSSLLTLSVVEAKPL
jgi:hypothetical protein